MSVALVPVTGQPTTREQRSEGAASPGDSALIHIELPGRATISVESGADSSLVRSILESLAAQVIQLPVGTKVWIAAGVDGPAPRFRRLECAGAERAA